MLLAHNEASAAPKETAVEMHSKKGRPSPANAAGGLAVANRSSTEMATVARAHARNHKDWPKRRRVGPQRKEPNALAYGVLM